MWVTRGPGHPIARRAEAAGRPLAGADGGAGGGELAAPGGERPPEGPAEAAEASALRHGPGEWAGPSGQGTPARAQAAQGLLLSSRQIEVRKLCPGLRHGIAYTLYQAA